MNGAVGVLLITAGVWFMYTGAKGLRPIALLLAIIKDPSNAGAIIETAETAAASSKAVIEDNAGTSNDPVTDPSGSGLTEPKAYALSQLSKYGWGKSEFDALDKLWTQESSWNPSAKNPSSGAYGIPQALPASKMATAGSDYMTNARTQINWGLGYIKGRYGSPSAAWKFHQANNWY